MRRLKVILGMKRLGWGFVEFLMVVLILSVVRFDVGLIDLRELLKIELKM